MGLVIDTSAFVDLERSEGSLEGLLAGWGEQPLLLPAIVVAELLVGVRLAASTAVGASRRAKVDALTARVAIVEFGREIAERWAELFAILTRRGDLIPASDLAVAATAVSFGFDVLVGSRDEVHFRRVPGLAVRTLGG